MWPNVRPGEFNVATCLSSLLICYGMLLALNGALGGQASESLVKVPTRSGVEQPFILVEPEIKPFASVILFPGGSGKLRTHRYGTQVKSKNFLVRTRQIFAGHGFLVVVVDTPTDLKREGLFRFRATEEHARDIKNVITWLSKRNNIPVFLIGTSRGTISAAGVTAQLKSSGIAGIVLTSTVTRYNNRGNKDRVFDVNMEQIRTPVLVVHHKDDACTITPYEDADNLMDSLVNAKHKKLLSYKGGNTPESDECKALSEHGFFGIEERVVGDIARWIKERVKAVKPGP